MPLLLASLLALLLTAGTVSAKELSDYAAEAKKLFSEQNIRSMVDVAKKVKDSGASYQPALTFFKGGAYGDKSREKDADLAVRLGVLQFDALYAAAFGRQGDVAACFQEQDKLLRLVNNKAQWDMSAVFPPELDWMMRQPDKVNFDDITDAYAAMAGKYEPLLSSPGGYALVEDLLYGFLTEGLYVVGQSVILSDYDPAQIKVLNDFQAGLGVLLGIYNQFADSQTYAAVVDADNFLRAGQRMGWMRPLYNLILHEGELTPSQVRAATAMAAKEIKGI